MSNDLSVVDRLAHLFTNFLLEQPHTESLETFSLYRGLEEDPEIFAIFRKALIRSFHRCAPDRRICEGNTLLSPLDDQMSLRIVRRGLMQEFAWLLAGKRPREHCCSSSLKEAKEALLAHGFTPKEIKERTMRFRKWLSGT